MELSISSLVRQPEPKLNLRVSHAFRARFNHPSPGASALAVKELMSLAYRPTLRVNRQEQQTLLVSPSLFSETRFLFSDECWMSIMQERVRLNSQIIDVKPRRSDDNCTLNRGILRINVSTLVPSVLLILSSNPGSARSITA